MRYLMKKWSTLKSHDVPISFCYYKRRIKNT